MLLCCTVGFAVRAEWSPWWLTCFINATLLISSFLSVPLYHTYHHFGSVFLLYCAKFNLRSLYSGVWHLCSICLHFVFSLSSCPSGTPSICVFPLALAPIFIQIHRPVSVWRLSDLSKVCRSTSPSHSALNPPASHCRPSKTGEHPEKRSTNRLPALNRGMYHSSLCHRGIVSGFELLSYIWTLMKWFGVCIISFFLMRTETPTIIYYSSAAVLFGAFWCLLPLSTEDPYLVCLNHIVHLCRRMRHVHFQTSHSVIYHMKRFTVCSSVCLSGSLIVDPCSVILLEKGYLIQFSFFSVFLVLLRRQQRRSTPSRLTRSSGNGPTSERVDKPRCQPLLLHSQRK